MRGIHERVAALEARPRGLGRSALAMRFGLTEDDSRICLSGWARGEPDGLEEVLTPEEYAARYPDGADAETWTVVEWRDCLMVQHARRVTDARDE